MALNLEYQVNGFEGLSIILVNYLSKSFLITLYFALFLFF